MDVQIKIKNLAQIRAAFLIAPFAMKKNLAKAIALSSQRLVSKSRMAATKLIYQSPESPTYRRTGLLRSRINVQLLTMTRAEVYSNVNYAIYVHEGTSRMRARPFMKVGLQDADKEIQTIFVKSVKDTLNEIGRRT